MAVSTPLPAILSKVDHTLLATTATWPEIQTLCEDAIRYRTASVCISPCYVAQVRAFFDAQPGDTPNVCTVIGFPNGVNTTAVKVAETADAVANGADEIDMVINLGWVKDRRWDDLRKEIDAVKDACSGKLLKVIVETCDLTPEERIKITQIVDASSADYIKTSTGFSKSGATFEDVEVFKANIKGGTKIKAAGGIKSLEDAETFIGLGASRLGTSRIVAIVKANEQEEQA